MSDPKLPPEPMFPQHHAAPVGGVSEDRVKQLVAEALSVERRRVGAAIRDLIAEAVNNPGASNSEILHVVLKTVNDAFETDLSDLVDRG